MTYQRDFITDADGTLLDITAGGEMKTSDATAQASLASIDTSLNNIEPDVDSINTILTNAKDPLNDALASIEVEHFNIHLGTHFFIQNYIEVTGSGVLNHTFLTGAKYVHMTFEINAADGGIIMQTYEGATGDSNGTTITPLNNSRPNTTASTVTVRENPTNTAVVGATLLRASRYGTAGAAPLRLSGNVPRGNEVILKPNTKYLIRVTNLSASANNISYNYNWYEQ